MPEEPLPENSDSVLEHTLGAMLRRMYSALSEQVYGRLEEAGYADIRPMHSKVMRHLTGRGARVTTLAEQAQITKQSMSAIVEELITLGYLEKRADPSDGRASLVMFTPRGKALQATLIRLSAEAEKVLAKNIGEQKYAQFRALLMEWTNVENNRIT
ncbi:MarR family winged helix-turn-helix transcriptional regulator [Sulfurimonas sp. HSL-1656]|uniref:MarR family winged helix-turn-helix transcriptional regulator n=1 Tax=Thiomicrolovo subterrani TaxID=3131934 RepID=UPI0031F8DF4D